MGLKEQKVVVETLNKRVEEVETERNALREWGAAQRERAQRVFEKLAVELEERGRRSAFTKFNNGT